MGDWLKRWLQRIAVVVVVAFLLTMSWTVYDGLEDSNGKADCAVLVSGPLGGDGKPTPEMRASLDRVANSLKAGDIRAILLAPSQSASGDAKSVIDAMSLYLGEQRIPRNMVLEDANGTTPEALGAEIAGYLTRTRQVSVLLVANYADIMRLKLALHRAGVTQVLTAHAGTVQAGDMPEIAGTAFFLWQNVFEQDVRPEAQKLVAQAKDVGQGLVSETPPAPPKPSSSASTVAPLAGGQTVNATGIGSFRIPQDWSQQIVYPIMDPVWAAPGAAGNFLFISKVNRAGSTSDVMWDMTSAFTAAHFAAGQTLDHGPFTTAAGLAGERMVVTLSKGSVTMDLAIYVFPGRGNAKVVLAAGCLASNATDSLPRFDSYAKTLQVW
jgi:hypothetical protein